MSVKFGNYVSTFLPASLTAGQTSILVNSTVGFPALNPGDWFYATLIDQPSWSQNISPPAQREIIKVTAYSGNTVTATRGVDGTVGQAWTAGSIVELRLNAQAIADIIAAGGGGSFLQIANNLSDVASAIASLNNLQYLDSLTGAVARGLNPKLSDWISVKDFGAVGDGVTDDTAAIQACINVTKNKVVYFPSGTYLISSALNINPASTGQDFRGSSIANSIIKTNSPTAHILNIVGSTTVPYTVVDLTLTSSVTKTAGSHIITTLTSSGFIQRVHFDNYLTAFTDNDNTGNIRDCIFSNPVPTTGVGIDLTGAAGGVYIESCLWEQVVSQPKAGIQIHYCGNVIINDCGVITQGIGLNVIPVSGTAASAIYVNNSFFDECLTGIAFNPSGTGLVQFCKFENCWTCGSETGVQNGVILGNALSANVFGTTFINHTSNTNNNNGVEIKSSAVDTTFIGGNFANNVGDGIHVNANVTNVTLSNVRCGNTDNLPGNGTFGIVVDAGTSSGIKITDCNLIGNTSGGLSLGAITGTNNVVHGNLGYNPVGVAAITVTASPFTYTAGHVPETVYITGGTVSLIVQGGTTLFTATEKTVYLGPNEAITLTYSGLPTMNKMVH